MCYVWTAAVPSFAGCAVLHVFDVSDRMALPPDFSAAVVVVVLLLLLAAAA